MHGACESHSSAALYLFMILGVALTAGLLPAKSAGGVTAVNRAGQAFWSGAQKQK